MHRMIRQSIVFTACALACHAAPAAPPSPLRPDHPLLGNWRFTLPDGSCTETHLIKPDGTTIVTSGDEVSESAIEVSDQPDSDGFYRWVDRIVRNNGKKDCAGSSTPVGDVATTWIRFDAGGDRMIMCFDKTLAQCMGPIVRVRRNGL
jgi:hypothetical protein